MVSVDTSLLAGLAVGSVVTFLLVVFTLPVLEVLLARKYPVPNRSGAIVISGASTGIGRHAAVTLAKKGFVAYAGVRNDKDFQSIKDEGIPNLRPLLLDVAKEDSIVEAHKRVTSELEKQKLPLVGLINNAGLANKYPIEFHPLPNLRYLYEVNVLGLVSLTQKFLPAIRKNKGRIINVSSFTALLPIPVAGAYASSKLAVEGLTDALRLEMVEHGVSVSALEPAYVATAIFGKITKAIDEDIEVSEEVKAVYGWHYRPEKRARDKASTHRASPPSVTSDAILHALTSPYPKTRYVLSTVNGMPAWVLAFLSWLLPDRVRDHLVLKSS